jgi:uncharacterized membrane protein
MSQCLLGQRRKISRRRSKIKKRTKEKTKAIGKYVAWWVATLFVGFICGVLVFAYSVCEGCEPRTFYLIGLWAGITGTTAYFMLFSVLTPVAKWVWGKIRHNPKSFIKLIK